MVSSLTKIRQLSLTGLPSTSAVASTWTVLPAASARKAFLDRDGLAVQGEGRARLAHAPHRVAEIEGGDVGRDGHFLVVGIDDERAFAAGHGRSVLTVAAAGKGQGGRREEQ